MVSVSVDVWVKLLEEGLPRDNSLFKNHWVMKVRSPSSQGKVPFSKAWIYVHRDLQMALTILAKALAPSRCPTFAFTDPLETY
jgi:hypothetical protein